MSKVRTKTKQSKAVWYSTIDKQYGILYMLANQIAVKYDNTALEQQRPYENYILQKVYKDLKDMGVATFLNKVPSVKSLNIYLNVQRKDVFKDGYHKTPEGIKSRDKILQVAKRK
jgi:hypothetical protein